MERGNSKHGPRLDEEMQNETRGIVQGAVAHARVDEFRMKEPAGEDQPATTLVPDGEYRTGTPGEVTAAEREQLSQFARYIGLSALPGDREALRRSAEDLTAPDDVLDEIDRLPPDVTYRTVAEIWTALGHRA